MEYKSVLHVFNGDCAADAWKRSVPAGERYLVWRENYLEGPLPPPDTSREEFARIRAEFLHACAPQYSVEALTRFQCGIGETLLALGPNDAVMLWFDDCMLDTLLLARILFLLDDSPAELHLCGENRVLGNESGFFHTPWQTFRRLAHETIRQYAGAWRAVTSGSAALALFLQSGGADAETALKRGLSRYLADHPADGSLGLSERKLIDIVSGGIHDFPQIFRAFQASEDRPFMGDTSCERLLQSLADRGYLVRKTDTCYEPADSSVRRPQA